MNSQTILGGKTYKNAFKMCCETLIPSSLDCSESSTKKNMYVAIKKSSFIFDDVIHQIVLTDHLACFPCLEPIYRNLKWRCCQT